MRDIDSTIASDPALKPDPTLEPDRPLEQAPTLKPIRMPGQDVTMPPDGRSYGAGRFRVGDEILGRYVVEDELGQGGMGVVYRCIDKVGGVKVAVKGLPPEVAHRPDEMVAVRENFQLVHGLRHDNIAAALTLERDDRTGEYFLIMDLASGVNLDSWMAAHGGAANRVRQLDVLRQIAAALDYAHLAKPRGIIHRDIKPANVMVDEADRVMILDFGLAAAVRASMSRVSLQVRSTSGTPVYKSPEQWRGQPQRAAADQYALAVIAYQMFSGAVPFDGDDLDILGRAVLNEPVQPIPGASAAVNAALAKGLAKRPEERFPSCTAFVRALAEAQSATLEETQPPKFAQPPKGGHAAPAREQPRAPSEKSATKFPLTQALAAAAVLALVSGVGLLGYWLREKPTAVQTSSNLAPPARTERTADGLYKVIDLATGMVDDLAAVPSGGWTEEHKTSKLVLRRIEPGSFTMGSPDGTGSQPREEGREDDEVRHSVTLTKPYYLGVFEVTQGQWRRVMGVNPSKNKAADHPVERVSWNDCQKFCRQAGFDLRLPTEAEWEYACRADSTAAYAGTGRLDDMGWYWDNAGGKTHAVGTKQANAWGLHDMHGNVYEWCHDVYGAYPTHAVEDPQGPAPASGASRVRRGGSWSNNARNCRSAFRGRLAPDYCFSSLGFRVCCSAGPSE